MGQPNIDIANISWRQVVGCQHIMHYMLYNISQEIEVLPLSQQIMIFQVAIPLPRTLP